MRNDCLLRRTRVPQGSSTHFGHIMCEDLLHGFNQLDVATLLCPCYALSLGMAIKIIILSHSFVTSTKAEWPLTWPLYLWQKSDLEYLVGHTKRNEAWSRTRPRSHYSTRLITHMLCSTQSIRVKPATLRRSGEVGRHGVRVRSLGCLCTQHNTTPVTPSFKYLYNYVIKSYYVMDH